MDILFPGVYVEELPTGVHPIEGVSTSTAAFMGTGPRSREPVLVGSFGEYVDLVGADVPGFLSLAVRGFFENGGRRCVVTVGRATDPIEASLEALEGQPFSLLCCPDEHRLDDAAAKMVAYCERRKRVFCLLQSPPPPHSGPPPDPRVRSSFAAYYHPWLVVPALDGQTDVAVPAGGHVAGAFARTDAEHGVHRPAGPVRLLGVQRLSHESDASDSQALSARGINVLRSVPGQGVVIWGTRTTSGDPQWKYVSVRRLLLFIEESIDRGLRWAVLEPNGPGLWHNVARAVEEFLWTLWNAGGLAGAKPETAFFVRCDRTTMTQADLDNGRFVLIVGVAPIRPAEFVLIRIVGQTGAQAADHDDRSAEP